MLLHLTGPLQSAPCLKPKAFQPDSVRQTMDRESPATLHWYWETGEQHWEMAKAKALIQGVAKARALAATVEELAE